MYPFVLAIFPGRANCSRENQTTPVPDISVSVYPPKSSVPSVKPIAPPPNVVSPSSVTSASSQSLLVCSRAATTAPPAFAAPVPLT